MVHILRTVGVVVAGASALIGGVALGGEPGHRSVQRSFSSPRAGADSYLRAVMGNRCSEARSMTPSREDAWCGNPIIKRAHYEGVTHIPASQAGVDEECVRYTITTTGSSDGSLAAGTTPWSYCYAHTHSGWKMHAQGTI